jgi:hypothetical protein
VDFNTVGIWTNWLNDLAHKGPVVRPTSQGELLAAVELAVSQGRRIRAVGSGHSYSTCARPRDIYVDLSKLSGVIADPYLRSPAPGLGPGETAIRLLAGTTIKELNRKLLPQRKLALPNMGSFDAQTLAGAISTGTHGTGLKLGNLADLVLSMEVVTVEADPITGAPRVGMRRIEPTSGITDAVAFRAAYVESMSKDDKMNSRSGVLHSTQLEQRDETFYASVISFGCIGIVYSYTLRVMGEHWLQEDIDFTSWSGLRLAMQPGGPGKWAGSVRNRWFLLNIAAAQGKNQDLKDAGCLLVSRTLVQGEPRPARWPAQTAWPPERIPTPHRDCYVENSANFDAEAAHPSVASAVNDSFKLDAKRAPVVGDYYKTASYIAHRRQRDDTNSSAPPEPPPEALSVEFAAPVDKTIELVEQAARSVVASPYFYIVPMGVRFAASSIHLLSANYGRETVYVEVPMVLPRLASRYARGLNDIAKPDLRRVANEILGAKLDARPHLGKFNAVSNPQLATLFPFYSRWYENYSRFNRFGTFNNDFTDQLGISK